MGAMDYFKTKLYGSVRFWRQRAVAAAGADLMSPVAETLRPRPPAVAENPGARPPAPAAFRPEALPAPGRGADAVAPEKPGRRGLRRVLVAVVAGGILAGGGAFGWHWWTVGSFIESTDDAYVRADIVGISAEVAGTVVTLSVDDNAHVEAGDVLVSIDPRDYEAAVASAKAAIAAADAAIADVDARRTLAERSIDVATADVATAQANLDFAESDYNRNVTLQARGTVPPRTLQEAETGRATARAALDRATATLASNRQQLEVLAAERRQREADLASANAQLATAELNLSRTTIRAPRAGVVGNRGVEVGAYVRLGQQIMSVVPDTSYVVANFKETQIADVRPGMPAEIRVDMLGGRTLPGTVTSLAPASGAEFAILPPQNATGNFTKIVQRVPVKISLDRTPGDGELALRPGTSVVVSVDTRGADGAAHATAAAVAARPAAANGEAVVAR
jgi:membrane fusion protein (multidrug efflux system)